MWFKQFNDIVAKNGKIIGARFNQKYFEKHQHDDLWNKFIESISHLKHLDKVGAFKFLQVGYTSQENTPKCHCGNLIGFIDDKISSSCSSKCVYTSPSRITKLKTTLSKIDKKSANEKRARTMLEKYGKSFNSQREEIHHRWTKTRLPDDIFNKLNDEVWLNEEYNVKKRTGVDIAAEIGAYYGTVLEFCRKFGFKIRQRTNYSIVELEIIRYIESLGFSVAHSNWEILGDFELDVVIEEKKLAIEVDGLYWHSLGRGEETIENKEKHRRKTKLAEEKGYILLHITDHEWTEKNGIVKDIISSKLGMNDKIPARKCDIREVDNKMTKEFLVKNHIQGYATSKYNYGLYFNDELVMIATFGKPRFNKNFDFELIRLSTKLGVSVIGGMSKLISAFRRRNSGSIVSYCDLRFGNGNSYIINGFKSHGESSLGYVWSKSNIVVSRYKTQKNTLKSWLPSFDSDRSESDNMFDAGYKRYWDCGQKLFHMK